MQTSNGTEAEMERLSMQLDQMESWKIAHFVIVTAIRLFSIFACAVMVEFILKHGPIRNKVNTLVVNLCVVVSINFVFCSVYQFFRWKNSILPENIFETLSFIYFISYISFISAIFILPLFWFLFLTFRNLFHKFDFLILIGLTPPYIIPSIFTASHIYLENYNIHKLYYHFILYYCFSLLITFSIFIYYLMLKLEERLNKNKLDYLLYVGTSLLVMSFPEILCFTFELYFFDDRLSLFLEIYHVNFSVDLIKCIGPLFVFTWLTISNKYFRKACKKMFSKRNMKRIFFRRKKVSNEDNDVFVEKLDLNEVFL